MFKWLLKIFNLEMPTKDDRERRIREITETWNPTRLDDD